MIYLNQLAMTFTEAYNMAMWMQECRYTGEVYYRYKGITEVLIVNSMGIIRKSF